MPRPVPRLQVGRADRLRRPRVPRSHSTPKHTQPRAPHHEARAAQVRTRPPRVYLGAGLRAPWSRRSRSVRRRAFVLMRR
jgi:hypothetical protein